MWFAHIAQQLWDVNIPHIPNKAKNGQEIQALLSPIIFGLHNDETTSGVSCAYILQPAQLSTEVNFRLPISPLACKTVNEYSTYPSRITFGMRTMENGRSTCPSCITFYFHTRVSLLLYFPTYITFAMHTMVSRYLAWRALIFSGVNNRVSHRKTWFARIAFGLHMGQLTSDIGYQHVFIQHILVCQCRKRP